MSERGARMPRTSTPERWDPPRIKCELERRHHTLASVAKLHGLQKDAGRHALIGKSVLGAIAIARVLDGPFRTLFPHHYVRGPARDRADAFIREQQGSRDDRHRHCQSEDGGLTVDGAALA